jgi:hypothetical protein
MYPQSIINRFHESYQPVPECGCWLWDRATFGRGYGSFFVTKTRPKPWNDKAHRASWIIHNGPIPEGMHVLHKCDVPSCVNPDHLFLGTNADNIADRLRKSRPKTGQRGEENHKAKLKANDIAQIRKLYKAGESARSMALDFGVAISTIYAIAERRSWRDLP